MLKIRDLAIHVIPTTMRPPEIGGGAYAQPSDPCHPSDTPQCKPSCQPSPPNCPQSRDRYDAAGFADSAVQQLKQQLRDRAALQV